MSPKRTHQVGQESAAAELEALLRLTAARRLLDAVVTGEWMPDDYVVAAAQDLVGQGRRWLAVSGMFAAA